MSLKNIIKGEVSIVGLNSSIYEAARQMYNCNEDCVVVLENISSFHRRPVGIFTDRDLALLFAKNKNIDVSSKKVGEVVSRNIITVKIDDGIYETLEKMRNQKVERVPVVNRAKQLLGIIRSHDILKTLADEVRFFSDLSGKKNAAFFNNESWSRMDKIEIEKDIFILQT